MTQVENQQWEVLNCSCIVYRVVLSKPNRDKVTGKLLRGAFLLRNPTPDGRLRDTQGLSVTLVFEKDLPNEKIAQLAGGGLTTYFAVGSLHTGNIRNVKLDSTISTVNICLDVVRDALTHANITGLPRHDGDTVALAEHLATKLAEKARCIWFR